MPKTKAVDLVVVGAGPAGMAAAVAAAEAGGKRLSCWNGKQSWGYTTSVYP